MATAASTVRSVPHDALLTEAPPGSRSDPTHLRAADVVGAESEETDRVPGGVRACPVRLADAANVARGQPGRLAPYVLRSVSSSS